MLLKKLQNSPQIEEINPVWGKSVNFAPRSRESAVLVTTTMKRSLSKRRHKFSVKEGGGLSPNYY